MTARNETGFAAPCALTDTSIGGGAGTRDHGGHGGNSGTFKTLSTKGKLEKDCGMVSRAPCPPCQERPPTYAEVMDMKRQAQKHSEAIPAYAPSNDPPNKTLILPDLPETPVSARRGHGSGLNLGLLASAHSKASSSAAGGAASCFMPGTSNSLAVKPLFFKLGTSFLIYS